MVCDLGVVLRVVPSSALNGGEGCVSAFINSSRFKCHHDIVNERHCGKSNLLPMSGFAIQLLETS